MERFKKDTYIAINERISLNPILNSFQETVNRFRIETELIDLFLHSTELVLSKTQYDVVGFKEIYSWLCRSCRFNVSPRVLRWR